MYYMIAQGNGARSKRLFYDKSYNVKAEGGE